ncbi:HlyD family efflux transporter periplasmic adaptor subunit [Microbacterium sp. NPDC057659]|uniref:HlyD family efflux transporter periplasmic adaptor subunit n=1 Tax=Microbacterium sp. NPDC057659 TaxID=3346198 RepID=UPI00366CE849
MTADDDLFDLSDSDDMRADEAPAADTRARRGAGAFFTRRRNRVLVGIAVTALVLASGTTAVYAATRGGDGDYRTAVTAKADVTEALDLSGQLASAKSADASFQVAGTVASVTVSLGDEVTAGQALAALDTGDLSDAVTKAEDTVASAQQTLEDDLDAQSNGASSSSASGNSSGSPALPSTGGSPQKNPGGSTPGGSTPGGSTPGGSTPGGSTPGESTPGESTPGGDNGPGDNGSGSSNDEATKAAIAAVTTAQQKLLEKYGQSVSAGEASRAALTSAQQVCAPFLDAKLEVPAENGSADGGDAAALDEAAIAALQTALKDAQGQLTNCQDAVSATQSAQQTTETANGAVSDAAKDLNDAVTALQEQLSASDGSGTDSTDGESSQTGTTAGTSAFSSTLVIRTAAVTSMATPDGMTGGSGSSGTITAEKILADQAAIDAAEAQLAIAKQDLALATLTSPIDGTIVSVGMVPGDTVSAGSDTAVITVQSAGGYVVEVGVGLSRIGKVEVGQDAKVVLPAFGAEYDATVASIGVLNTSSTSTPSYTVTLAVDAGDDTPRIGATATATVQLAAAKDVLTVPTSAVTRSGSAATVDVLIDGAVKKTAVTLGAVGAERTEIAKGLSAGDVVVLADLDQAITSDDTSTSTRLGSGRFSSGDFPSPGSGSGGGDFPAPPGS